MRNNEGRIGAVQTADTPPANTSNSPVGSTSLLNFVVPTDFVELPSKGKFYSEDHPLYNVDNIEIRQMTAKDEDILTSRALLQKGIAIDRLIENLIVDKQIKSNDLLVGDKNAIMMTARISAYGNVYNTSVTCPICAQTSQYDFDLNNVKWQTANDEDTDAEVLNQANCLIILPVSKIKVEVKFLTTADEKRLIESAERKRKRNLKDTSLTDQMKAFIVSANGVVDRSELADFIDEMPAKDSRYLRTEYVKLVPNIDLTQNFVCKYCISETKLEVPFTTDFFWPR